MGYFLRGLLIGFSIAAPVGPIGVLCIRRTLSKGWASGFLSGLGAASADACYGSIAAFGLTVISGFLIERQIWLRLLGGVFLCFLGVRTFLARPSQLPALETRPEDESTPPDLKVGTRGKPYPLLGDYVSTFLLTLTNPMTILSFVAILAGLGLGNTGGSIPTALLLILGVFFGSTLWWLILSTGANAFRARFLTPQGLQWVNWISGLIITGFGLAALLSAMPGLVAGR